MMTIATKENWYNSFNIICDFYQLRDNLHLYLLDLNMIVDEDKIVGVDIDWQFDEKFLVVSTSFGQKLQIPSYEFEIFVQNGLQL